jgi:hypothetical protein
MRKQAGLRLTEEALAILDELSAQLGISRAAVVELATRHYAASVQGKSDPVPVTPPAGARAPRTRTRRKSKSSVSK